MKSVNENYDELYKVIHYENEKFETVDILLYNEMLDIFKTKMQLAYPYTREWYNKFSHFVGLWNGFLNKKISRGALKKVVISEKELKPFYLELENKHDSLINNLFSK